MNMKDCLDDLTEILELVQSKIDKSVSQHRYEESALLRDIKKEIQDKITKIKKKQL